MIQEDGRDSSTPRRFRTLRFNPLRALLPWFAVAAGLYLTIRGATGGMDAIFVVLGPALVVLGIAAFFLYRWMAKRGI